MLKLLTSADGKRHWVNLHQIVRLEGVNGQTVMHLADLKHIIIDRPLGDVAAEINGDKL